MLERTALPHTSRPAPDLHLPRRAGMSPQFVQFALVVMGIALVTFIMYLYVLPNSQINAARTQIAQLQERKSELHRRDSEVLQEIARYSDLKTLEIRARQIGMGPVQSAIYLNMPEAGDRQLTDRIAPADTAGGRGAEFSPQNKLMLAGDFEQQARKLLNDASLWADGILSRLLGD